MATPQSVCVIGAGALGLVATKVFLQGGFQVTGFEARDYVGGLWKDSRDSTLSVHATTIFNSSKWRSCFSDFPFSDDANTYPTAVQILRYLESYADHFGLREHYHLGTKVLQIRYLHNKWAVTVLDGSTGQRRTEHFDKVCVATGAFHKPRSPRLTGAELFQGKVIHSIDFHGDQRYDGQNVLLVGLHATAQDVCCALAESAQHVYLSHRRGLLLLPRFRPDGATFDSTGTVKNTFVMTFLNKYLSAFFWWLMQRILSKQSRETFPDIPDAWGLNPAPSAAIRTPLMADALWPLLDKGFAEPVPEISRITGPNSVLLADGRTLENIETIIYCTGYEFSLPDGLIPKDEDSVGYNPYPQGREGKEPLLYRNIFPMHKDESIRTSLAFLGHGYIVFPGFIQFQLTAQAVCQVWQQRPALPPLSDMEAWHKQHLKRRQALHKRYSPLENSTFYPILLDLSDQLTWLDETAGTGLYQNLSWGWLNWRAWRLWWKNRKLYHILLNGLFTPAIWSLFPTGRRPALQWDECVKLIFSENQRAEADRKSRVESLASATKLTR